MTTASAQRPGRRTTPAEPGTAASEFRVRFSAVRGLLALLRAPSNSFGWVGPGKVRIESYGVLLSGRPRRILGFAGAEQRFLTAAQIRAAYREGSEIRVDLREPMGQHPFVRFWAESPTAAGAIVEALPTAHTIELEAAPAGSPRSAAASKTTLTIWLPLAGSLVLAAILGWFATALLRTSLQTPQPGNRSTRAYTYPTTRSPAPASRATTLTAPGPTFTPQEIVAARQDLQLFGSRMAELTGQFSKDFTALQDGRLSQEAFAQGLEMSLIPRWETLEHELESQPDPAGAASTSVRQPLIDAALSWQRALKAYANGLQTHDANMVLSAFDYLKEAEDDLRQAGTLGRELEQAQSNPVTR